MTFEVPLKFIHLTAMVVFLGDIVVTAVWKWYADQTRQPAVVTYAARQVLLTDKYLLIPSIIVLLGTGFLSAFLQKIPVSSPPYIAAQTLFFFSGIVWKQA